MQAAKPEPDLDEIGLDLQEIGKWLNRTREQCRC